MACIWGPQLFRSRLDMQTKLSAECNQVESGQKFLNENWCLCFSRWINEAVPWYLMYTYRSISVVLSRWGNDSTIAHHKKTIQWKRNLCFFLSSSSYFHYCFCCDIGGFLFWWWRVALFMLYMFMPLVIWEVWCIIFQLLGVDSALSQCVTTGLYFWVTLTYFCGNSLEAKIILFIYGVIPGNLEEKALENR